MKQLRFYGARYFASKFLAGNIRVPVVLFSLAAHYDKIIYVTPATRIIGAQLEVKVHGRVHT